MRRYRTESDFDFIRDTIVAYLAMPEHQRRVNGLVLAVKQRLQNEGILFPREFTRNFEPDAISLDNDIRRVLKSMDKPAEVT